MWKTFHISSPAMEARASAKCAAPVSHMLQLLMVVSQGHFNSLRRRLRERNHSTKYANSSNRVGSHAKLELASAPWIAMVSCDTNSTGASMEIDIFTLARDKGAVAAVRSSFRHAISFKTDALFSCYILCIPLHASSTPNTLILQHSIKFLIYFQLKARPALILLIINSASSYP
jgi:hypothetical protein